MSYILYKNNARQRNILYYMSIKQYMYFCQQTTGECRVVHCIMRPLLN